MSRRHVEARIAPILGVAALLAAGMALRPAPLLAQAQILEVQAGLGNLDNRPGLVQPTAAQKGIVSALGARARWNRFGTPVSLVRYDGYLATGLAADPEVAARQWVRENKALFRLSNAGVDALQTVGTPRLAGDAGHVVVLRQTFGGLPAGNDGLITVAVRDGKVAYVSSSAAGDGNAPAPATITPAGAWLAAAASVGRSVPVGAVGSPRSDASWTVFDVSGFSHPQRARLVAMPTPTQGVKAAYETIVLDVGGGAATAYTVFVDARTGGVLLRANRTEQLAAALPATALLAPQTSEFSGEYRDDPNDIDVACGPRHPFDVPVGTVSIQVVATAAVFTNDIVINLYKDAVRVASIDTGLSPEALSYEVDPATLPDVYEVEICPLVDSINPEPQPPYTYAGTFTANDAPVRTSIYPPKWNLFPANPLFGSSLDVRTLACWVSFASGNPVPGCEAPFQSLQNLAARFPWDQDTRTNEATFTTRGNAALSGEAWLSPLTPAEQYRPVSANRVYDFPWTDQWRVTRCSPTAFASAGRNDIDAATANLFAMHNRMHDWAYFLGFTEETWNLQENNFGNDALGVLVPGDGDRDPEVGNSQAGAVSGGTPSFLGRDNANQITLNDGIAPITNMYLWQPIAAAFYSPCVDGDYDMSVIGHEYTHAISNRMIAGPDNGILSDQGRAMGESWSDLNAVEYLNEYGLVPVADENPFSVGAYVTGNKQTGIRNYAMNASPLNYSDVGYDFVCNAPITDVQGLCATRTQVHSDGEIWSAANFDIRQALIQKYDAAFPASSAALQRDCADGKRRVEECPGNRRWIQIVHDSFLMLQSDASMLDARDAMLGADRLRFGGANQAELWRSFARRGMGVAASTPSGDAIDPVPSFESALGSNATVRFRPVAADEGRTPIANARIFVGRYEAAVTPIADTDASTALGDQARFAPGAYEILVQAPGYGHVRLSRAFSGNKSVTVTVPMPTNWASASKGATISGDGINLPMLIDDTESTNWARLLASATPAVQGVQATVDLSGGLRTIRRVQVSAMLRERRDTDPGGDTAGQNRYSALRAFEIWACNANLLASQNCLLFPTGYTRILPSPADAFPATVPRPLAPNLTLGSFAVPETKATHVRLAVVSNQCTGGPAYQGDQDDDPANDSDCVAGSNSPARRVPQGGNVRAAELQVFSQ